MKLSKQLIQRLGAAMDERGMCKMDLAKKAGISHSTVGRWFSGSAKNITDETVELLSQVFSIPIAELMILSLGGMPPATPIQPRNMALNEDDGNYSDIFDRLASWLRLHASDEFKKGILMMANGAGFQDKGFTHAINALCEPTRSRTG